MIEVRHEPPDGPAAQALWDEYMELVRERAGPGFEPTQRIFATVDVFRGPNAAWIVLYDDGAPVACAGLRELEPGAGEIKRMFVTPRARGRGLARRLLAELEGIARDAGQREIRLFTTDMLPEAMRALRQRGLRGRREHPVEDGRTEFWLEKAPVSNVLGLMPEQLCTVNDDVELCYETFGDPERPRCCSMMGLATQMVGWHEDFCAAARRAAAST